MVVSNASDESSVVASVEMMSPLVDIELCGGGGGFVAPVEGISPARAMPQSAHARTTANVKRLIRSVSPLSDASLLARNHISVYTYAALDTASRTAATIPGVSKCFYTHRQRFIFREDSLTNYQNFYPRR